jgi:hypothetical protein
MMLTESEISRRLSLGATFRVLVRGERLVVRRWLIFRRTLGFYATRVVTAASREAAEQVALRELQGEPRLAIAALRAPALVVEEVEPVDADSAAAPPPGIVFFPETQDQTS